MTLLTKYEPFVGWSGLDQWMEEDFVNLFPSGVDSEGGHWHPAVDIWENPDGFVIKMELPEVDEKRIEMTLEKGLLTVRGERNPGETQGEGRYRRRERRYGAFARSFRLPDSVDADKVSAQMRQGVLTIVLPKKEETKPRTITVQVQ